MSPFDTRDSGLAIDADRVVADDLRFKAKLAIGEQAYTSLRVVNRAREVWDVLGAAGTGAAVAKSSLIATTFFAPSGLMGALGLGTAVTPVGWVAFAALASGGACYGLYRLLGNSRGQRVIEIPRYLNTPLDQLGLAIFDLIAPLALRIAAVDGQVDSEELAYLHQHLTQEWGLDQHFVTSALDRIGVQASSGDLQEMARERSVFLHANPDCNHEAIATDVGQFLRAMLETSGSLTTDELTALQEVETMLRQPPPSELSKAWLSARQHAEVASGVVVRHAMTAANLAKQAAPTKEALRDAAANALQGAQGLAEQSADLVTKAAPVVRDAIDVAGQRVRGALGKLKRR